MISVWPPLRGGKFGSVAAEMPASERLISLTEDSPHGKVLRPVRSDRSHPERGFG